MLPVAEALQRILKLMAPVGTETVPLAAAAGRVLAADAVARRTQPPFAASAMDGYALAGPAPAPGARFRVIGTAQAGAGFDGRVGPGEAVRIFTGAPLPEGAERVLIQEDAARDGDAITVLEGRGQASHVRPAGCDFQAGARLVAPRRLGPRDIALLAAMNVAEVVVRRRPLVALIPTGDELVWPGEEPGPEQIVSSNNFGLKALFEPRGAEVHLLPIARDNRDSLISVLGLAEGADLIVTLGGASVGDHDLVQTVATEAGLALDFHKVAMRPGKPLMAGRYGDAALVGLPGNPVSTMVCGAVFILPALDALLGLPAGPAHRQQARLTHGLAANGQREHYMRACVTIADGGPQITVAERQDSALLSVLQTANALAIQPPGTPALKAGDNISFINLD